MSLIDILKCPRGGLHVFRFGTCANCRMPEAEWRRRNSARSTLIAVLGGMTRRESSEIRVYYALSATVLIVTLLFAARQSGLIFWLLSDPSEGQ